MERKERHIEPRYLEGCFFPITAERDTRAEYIYVTRVNADRHVECALIHNGLIRELREMGY